jgi:hypothetical protein
VPTQQTAAATDQHAGWQLNSALHTQDHVLHAVHEVERRPLSSCCNNSALLRGAVLGCTPTPVTSFRSHRAQNRSLTGEFTFICGRFQRKNLHCAFLLSRHATPRQEHWYVSPNDNPQSIPRQAKMVHRSSDVVGVTYWLGCVAQCCARPWPARVPGSAARVDLAFQIGNFSECMRVQVAS